MQDLYAEKIQNIPEGNFKDLKKLSFCMNDICMNVHGSADSMSLASTDKMQFNQIPTTLFVEIDSWF